MGESKAASTVGATIGPVLALTLVCLVAGVLLGFVHAKTEPVIAEVSARRAEAAYSALVEGATTFTELDSAGTGCVAALSACDDAGTELATIIVSESAGYGGQVRIAVAFDESGTVSAITVLESSETPGLGSRVEDSDYLSQYVGKGTSELSEGEADLISGATISSRAVLRAFNAATAAYEEVR